MKEGVGKAERDVDSVYAGSHTAPGPLGGWLLIPRGVTARSLVFPNRVISFSCPCQSSDLS